MGSILAPGDVPTQQIIPMNSEFVRGRLEMVCGTVSKFLNMRCTTMNNEILGNAESSSGPAWHGCGSDGWANSGIQGDGPAVVRECAVDPESWSGCGKNNCKNKCRTTLKCTGLFGLFPSRARSCLLYTSDAAAKRIV